MTQRKGREEPRIINFNWPSDYHLQLMSFFFFFLHLSSYKVYMYAILCDEDI